MKYLQTSDEILFESLINESIVYFSPELRDSLKHLSKNNSIAKSLSELEGEDIQADVTFLDFGSEGYLTFHQMPKAMKLIKSVWPDATDGNLDQKFDPKTSDILYKNDVVNFNFTGLWKGNRNQIKIGKVINKLLPGKFSEQDIENFVNQIKINKTYRGYLKIVEGEDIKFWYQSKNYESLSGSLGASCMRDSEDLKLYTKNPEVCKMLILVKHGKLVARALLWKLHSSTIPGSPEWFLDRVYVNKDADYDLIRDEAKRRNWTYRRRMGSGYHNDVIYKDKEYYDIQMTVKVKPGDYITYPYLDTFRRFVPRTGMLYNDDNYSETGIILTHTDGRFSTTRNRESGFFSRISNRLRDRLNPLPIIESNEMKLWRTISRQEWRDSKFKKRWDRFTEKEVAELEDILNFRELNLLEPRGKAEGWIHATDQYNIRFATLIIDIYKSQDEWYYIELVETKDSSHVYFEVDSFDGLEDLLHTIISNYKNKQPLWVL